MSKISEVIFDIETQKLFDEIGQDDIEKLGVSIVCAYRRTVDEEGREIEGEMGSFWEKDLSGLWQWMERADRIIGYNSVKFDVAILAPLAPYDIRKLPHFDILDHIKAAIGYRMSLDAMARETLGKEKNDVGINAVIYWREATVESLAKLEKYCRMDVEVTRDLYDYGRKNGKLSFIDKWNVKRNIDVDFSYPKIVAPVEEQMGLF